MPLCVSLSLDSDWDVRKREACPGITGSVVRMGASNKSCNERHVGKR